MEGLPTGEQAREAVAAEGSLPSAEARRAAGESAVAGQLRPSAAAQPQAAAKRLLLAEELPAPAEVPLAAGQLPPSAAERLLSAEELLLLPAEEEPVAARRVPAVPAPVPPRADAKAPSRSR